MGKSHQKGWVVLRGKKWYGYFRREVIDPETNQLTTNIIPVVLGPKSELSKFEAKDALEREIAKRTGSTPANRTTHQASTTFGWFVRNRFLPLKEADWRERTAEVKKYLIEEDLIEPFDELPLEKIDKFTLQTHLNKLAKTHSKDRVLQIRAYMRAIFAEAVDQDFLPKDPARMVKVPAHLRETDKTVLTWDQLRSALAQLELRDRIILELDMTNALRPSELFGLRWKCFDRVGRSMSLMETTYMGEIRDWGKTKGSLKTIPLSKALSKELCEWEKECPDTSPEAFLFPNEAGGFIDTGNYRKRVLHKLARDLKLPKLTFQVIRRSIATLAQNKGTVKDVQGVLRHSRTATTTDVYMQEIPEGVRATIDAIHKELKKAPASGNTRSAKKRNVPAVKVRVAAVRLKKPVSNKNREERRSAGSFKTPSQKGFENLLPNATKVLPEGVAPLTASA